MNKCRENIRRGKSWVRDIAKEACRLLNLPALSVYETNAGYACALINENGRSYLKYNPERLGNLRAIHESLAAVVVLKTIGHYYHDCVSRNRADDRSDELYAFRTAGWLAHQSGLDLKTCLVIFDMPRFKGNKQRPVDETCKVAFQSGWLESSRPIAAEPVPDTQGSGAIAGLSVVAGVLLLASIFRA